MNYYRKEFEEWVIKTSRRVGTYVGVDNKGKYTDNRVDAKWASWKAAIEMINNSKEELK